MNKANAAKKQSTSNITTDYKAAMQVFNNELLTEACQLLLSNISNHDKPSREKCDEEFHEIYKRCYKASETISKVESLPGFSINTAPQQKQPHRNIQMPSGIHRKGSFGSANTSNAPAAGFQPKKNHGLQKPNSLKRSVSAGSSTSITSSLTSNHSTRRTTSPTPMQDDSKRAAPPANAMKFLQALNQKADSSSKASSGTKRGVKPSSGGQPTKRMRKMSREEKDEEEDEFVEDDRSSSGEEEEFEIENNAEPSNEFEKDDNTSTPKRRNNGKQKKNAPTEETGETFGVGEDVLVYYEPDDKWYEAIVSNVNTEKVEDSKFDSSSEGDKNTKTISRRSTRGQGGRTNKQSSDEKSNLKIVSYDVEYDNGEHHENVAPINIQGREH